MIQFAYPLALLTLLSIPVIIALHLLRPRRRRVVMPSTALWQAALADRERGLGFRRLLGDLSLLLLIASAAALGLALAGPQWTIPAGAPADTVLVLDVSASMKTRAGAGTTRFDLALAQAAGIVERLPPGGRMLVMTSGRRARLRSGFETDRDALRRVLGELRPGDEAGRPREALALALSLLRNREQGRIVFVTDGAYDPDVDPGSPRVEFRLVGGPARNLAITRFDVRQEPTGEDRFQVLMTLRNYTEARSVVPATVSLEDRVLYREPLELQAREERTLVLPFKGRARGRAVGRIDVDDDLAADNQAFAVVSDGDPLRVLLYTPGNFFLESVLQALPGVDLVRREWSATEDLAALARRHDIVVFDGIAAPKLPPGNFVLVNVVTPGLPFSAAGSVARPAIRGRGSSALMRDVDLAAVRIERARRVVMDPPAAGLQRLFWSAETDLALALLASDVKLVYLGFDLHRSNFPLQGAFPVFFRQSLEWLRPRGEAALPTHLAAGTAIAIPAPPGAQQVIVRTPSGSAETLAVAGDSLRFGATAEAGIYGYTAGEMTRYFAVALADALESDVNRRGVPADPGGEARPAEAGARALKPLWPHLLVLALALLLLEWCVWTGSRRRA